MQRRLKTIDNVKVLMMLAVALYHSCMFFTGSWFDGAAPVYEAGYVKESKIWIGLKKKSYGIYIFHQQVI